MALVSAMTDIVIMLSLQPPSDYGWLMWQVTMFSGAMFKLFVLVDLVKLQARAREIPLYVKICRARLCPTLSRHIYRHENTLQDMVSNQESS